MKHLGKCVSKKTNFMKSICFVLMQIIGKNKDMKTRMNVMKL